MSTDKNKFKLPLKLIPSQKNVWAEYVKLAVDYQPINLGQGFPDVPPSNYITETLAQVAKTTNFLHQYTRDYGHPRLVNILSTLYSKLIGREINAQHEILITVGAFQALFCSIMGHVDEGDEVIIIEPFFDCYEPMVRCAGGIPKFIPLRLTSKDKNPTSSDWVLDKTELEKLFNSKTKMIILNNPHNSIGKVFKMEELQHIAKLCIKWNVLCISDEVYEWIVYKPNKHIRIASLSGMWDRTITIGSAGKTFGVTGWKIGWAYGPSNLLHNLKIVHQDSISTVYTPIQETVAIAFETELQRFNQDDCYFNSISSQLVTKRDFMINVLTEIGMKPTIPEAGYFILADWTYLESKIDLNSMSDQRKDYGFTKWMIKNVGLQGMPPSAFYSQANKALGENFVRYCFFKKDTILEMAAKALREWKLKSHK